MRSGAVAWPGGGTRPRRRSPRAGGAARGRRRSIPSVAPQKKRGAATVWLRLAHATPFEARCAWKVRTSSSVSLSGDPPEEPAEPRDRVDAGSLRRRREVADAHVLGHAAAKRADLGHRRAPVRKWVSATRSFQSGAPTAKQDPTAQRFRSIPGDPIRQATALDHGAFEGLGWRRSRYQTHPLRRRLSLHRPPPAPPHCARRAAAQDGGRRRAWPRT